MLQYIQAVFLTSLNCNLSVQKQEIFYSRFSSKSGNNIPDGVAPMDQGDRHETTNCQSDAEILLPADTKRGGENTASSTSTPGM